MNKKAVDISINSQWVPGEIQGTGMRWGGGGGGGGGGHVVQGLNILFQYISHRIE